MILIIIQHPTKRLQAKKQALPKNQAITRKAQAVIVILLYCFLKRSENYKGGLTMTKWNIIIM